MSRDGFPSSPRLLARHIAYQLRYVVRVPVAFFFTLVFPLMVLVLVNALFGDGEIRTDEGSWPVRQFYVGGLAAFTAATATYTNLANMVPIRRDEGVLKRWRGTPTPTWIVMGGFIGSAIVLAFAGVLITLTFGVLFYDLEVEAAKMPAAITTFLVGAFALSALGMAVASLVSKAEAASAVANATILPLAFVSDVFLQSDDPPEWFRIVGNMFPLKPFVNAFQDCFTPFVEAPAFSPGRLAFVAAWGAVGVAVSLVKFRWEPSTGTSGRRSRRSTVTPSDADRAAASSAVLPDGQL